MPTEARLSPATPSAATTGSRRVAARLFPLFLAGCFGGKAMAAADDKFTPYVGYTVGHDSNVFGLDGDQDYRALFAQPDGADRTTLVNGGLKARVPVSRQQFELSADVSRARYARFPVLDHAGHDLQGAWRWSVGRTWSGRIGASKVRALGPMSGFREAARNLRTTRRNIAENAWLLAPAWQLRADLSTYTLQNELASQRFGDVDERKVETGVDYLAASGSRMGLVFAQVRGEYPMRPAAAGRREHYRQDEVKARIDWRVAEKTRIQMLLGLTRRDSFGARTGRFSGPGARLTADWAASDKTAFEGACWREIAAADEVLAAYSLNTGCSLAPTWKMSAKTALKSVIAYEKRAFYGSALPASDTGRSASLALSYAPWRKMALQMSVFALARDGNTGTGTYARRGAALTARYEF